MKKILVLTSIYPGKDIPKTFTPVVHYFTKEWVISGYQVLVINYISNFPKLFYFLSRPIASRISSRVGFSIRENRLADSEYVIDDVQVCRIAMNKFFPHSDFSKKEIRKAYNKTLEYCSSRGFSPDVIVSHWFNPQMRLMYQLKRYFNSPSCYVSHGVASKSFVNESNRYLFDDLDMIGYRSEAIRRSFDKLFNWSKPSFFCYSGVPDNYVPLEYNENRSFDVVKNFVYVGALIERKNPVAIIPALTKSFGTEPFSMVYVGDGDEHRRILEKARECHCLEYVHFLGRMHREEIVPILDCSDILIMISKNEVYGLVYLEAMARGCIVIASRNEGFDGIIRHGINGFLCKAGDSEELAMLITYIRSLSIKELASISRSAYETARHMTDSKVAKDYIGFVSAHSFNNV